MMARDSGSTAFDNVNTQRRVIGALIMREIHTRFGRDNVGLLWLLLEPMMLALAVTALHVGEESHSNGLSVTSFTIVGYTPFLLFRSIVGRSESTIDANRSLLYHYRVTWLDMLLARAVLEFCSVLFAVSFLLLISWVSGYGSLPDDPLLFLEGMALLLWFSFSLGLVVAAASEMSSLVARLVHPVMYIAMPLSGCFFSLLWLPTKVAETISWFPLTDVFEIIRVGQFQGYSDRYADASYVAAWCMGLTLVGLASLRLVRRHLELH